MAPIRHADEEHMKELLSKRFWQDVKKVFEEAQKDEPPTKSEPQHLLEAPAERVAAAEVPSSTSGSEP